MEPADVRIQLVLDQHPLGVSGEQVLGGGRQVVGQQQGGIGVSDVAHSDLAQRSSDALQVLDLLVQLGTAFRGAQVITPLTPALLHDHTARAERPQPGPMPLAVQWSLHTGGRQSDRESVNR